MNNTPATYEFGDFVQTFQIEDLNIRGRLIRLDQTYAEAIKAHDYPPFIEKLVGEILVLAAVLASALKYDGVFKLQVQGDGPVSLIMADITSDGAMRACAKIREGVDPADIAEGASIPQTLGAGHMAFTVDQGPDTDRYQGITEITGATLAECAQNYFRQSEQIETAIAITADANGPSHAAGLMVQRLPMARDGEQEEENWRRAVILMSSITNKELLDPSLSATKILYRLYHEDGIRLYEQGALRHECRCSEDRVSRTLRAFPRSEIDEMAEDGLITVTCEFCRTDYVYDERRLDDLFADAAGAT
ncbi:MAG: Hsp33 family molecular chaperone HslO [Rhodospirillales bacterium]|nr:Hsp33 family molecular chaperone HslO [Rhodospirillales bacterium]MBO6787988.1 Hsp33 family molecular chaperone HslO [Rhodospirillales bacterium]